MLLELTNKGLSREKAYTLVQKNALEAFNKPDGNFKQNLLSDPMMCEHLNADEIENCFDSSYYLRNIDEIYSRFGI